MEFVNNIILLLNKHLLLFYRRKGMFYLFLVLPFVIIFVINYAQHVMDTIYNSNSHKIFNPVDIQYLNKCIIPSDCLSLGVFIISNKKDIDPIYNRLLNEISVLANLRIDTDIKILLKTDNILNIDNYINNNKNKTQIGLIFCDFEYKVDDNITVPCPNSNTINNKTVIHYSILYNMTLEMDNPFFTGLGSPYSVTKLPIKLQNTILNAIYRLSSNNKTNINLKYKSYPSSLPVIFRGYSFLSNSGSFFIFIPISLVFLILINAILSEKDKKQKEFLLQFGISKLQYFISWILFSIILNSYSSIGIILFGRYYNFELFNNVNFVILFFFLFFSGFAISFLGIFAGYYSDSLKSGQIYGYGLLLVSIMFQIFFTNPNSNKFLYNKNRNIYLNITKLIFDFYPGFNFVKIWSDFVNNSGTHYDPTLGQYIKGVKFTSEIFYKKLELRLPVSGIEIKLDSCYNSFIKLILNILLILILIIIKEFIINTKINYSLFRKIRHIYNKIFKRSSLKYYNNLSFENYNESVINENIYVKNILNSDNNSLVINDLIVSYSDDNTILKNISFSISKNEIFSIVGKNGSGKTTLINTICNILQSDYGSITYNNKKIAKNKISLCPQFDIYWDFLTLNEHLIIYLKIKNKKLNKVDYLLSSVDLLSKKHEFMKNLSGGMKRRFSLLISLIGSPEIILFDEPTTGLDPINQHIILREIKKIKKDKIIILTTHFMNEVEELSDKIMILNKGVIEAIGNINSVLKEISNNNIFIPYDYNIDIKNNIKIILDELEIKYNDADNKFYLLESDSIDLEYLNYYLNKVDTNINVVNLQKNIYNILYQ